MSELLSDQAAVAVAAVLGLAGLLFALGRVKSYFQNGIPKKLERHNELLADLDKRLTKAELNYQGLNDKVQTNFDDLRALIKDGQRKSDDAHKSINQQFTTIREEFQSSIQSIREHESSRRKEIYDRIRDVESSNRKPTRATRTKT